MLQSNRVIERLYGTLIATHFEEDYRKIFELSKISSLSIVCDQASPEL